MPPKTPHIVMIGAGFSGTLTAIHLLRICPEPIELTLIDSCGSFGPGLAYSPPSDNFRLNVRTKAMSAFPEEPGHFFDWLAQRDAAARDDEFVSRRLYGEYLQALLTSTISEHSEHTCHLIGERCVGIDPIPETEGFSVLLQRGDPLVADVCVVAVGNLPRRRSTDGGVSCLMPPYVGSSYEDIDGHNSLGIIGSGLTAVDSIIESENRGFRGTYTVISRHGRFPLAHEDVAPVAVALPGNWTECSSIRELFKLVRALSSTHGSSQPVIEAMRPQLQTLWKHLSQSERSRFLRHIRPLWEIHRHRTPAQHRAVLDKLVGSGRLHLVRGRLVAANEEADSGVRITYMSPYGPKAITVDAALSCIGPESDGAKSEDPFIKHVLRNGLLESERLGLGLGVRHSTEHAQSLFLIGPLQRESLWEITAVRELRIEAHAVALKIRTRLWA